MPMIQHQHRKIQVTFIFCLSILLAVIISIPYVSYATTQDKLNEASQKVDELESQKANIESNLTNLNSQLESISNKISTIDTQITNKQTEIDAMTISLANLKISEQEQYDSMKKRIQYMYEHNSTSTIEALLSSQSLADLLVKSEYIKKISEYDRNMLVKLQETYATEATYTATLASDKSSLETLKTQVASQKAELDSLISNTQSQLTASTKDMAAAEAKAKTYEAQLEAERIEEERKQRILEQEAARLAALAAAQNSNNTTSVTNTSTITSAPISYNDSDVDMLAAIIECEAGGEPYIGKLAVGSTVINRVNSTRYPNTIAGVIYQSRQFSPVASGRFALVLARGANSSCYNAAKEVLSGNINVTALYFHVVTAEDTIGTVIGNHIFY